MANIFEVAGNYIAQRVAQYMGGERDKEYIAELAKRRAYAEGEQRKWLKPKPGEIDDNLILNLTGLAVDRSNAMLFGGGMEFGYTDKETPDAQFLESVWNVNRKDKWQLLLANDGEIYGTYYAKIVPDFYDALPRLVIMDPELMTIDADPLDADRVESYTWEVKINDRVRREVTRRAGETDVSINEDGDQTPIPSDTWIVETWESQGPNGKLVLVDSQHWPYPFPPILHGQNMPGVHSIYGVSGIDSTQGVQDKINLEISDVLKILRQYAHPQRWGKGSARPSQVDGAPGKLWWFTDPGSEVNSLEMQSDLASSIQVLRQLRQTLFDLARVVDVQSFADKLGNLTNFAVRVLYGDAVAKNAVRRLLYGEFFTELNRRLLFLGGFETVGPPEIHWGPDMPADEAADAQMVINDLSAGLVSKETASQKRGYDWEQESAKLGEEATASAATNGNIGGLILSNFTRGR